jgi:uncharacterized damage-inducible protein DinB
MSEAQDLSLLVAGGLAAYYERVRGRVHALVGPLSTEQLWRRPFPFGNSVGHLLQHLTGNLSYYIGAQVAGSGYVRDRPREFADAPGRPKEEVLAAFDQAVATVIQALGAQRPEDWAAPYAGVGAEDVADRLGIFIRCAAHADHHAGQMVYLCKQLALA